MARQSQGTDARQERAQRILDTAAALILRWGYNKTTIDDIAREAGVAKGTIYLHWKSREELFAALVTREKLAIAEDIKQYVQEDPAGATLPGLCKYSALATMKRPLMKAILLRDMDVLGKLANSEHSTIAYAERLAGFKAYFELLREHDLVRTDISLNAQVYIFGAIFTGFFVVKSMMPNEFALADEEIADLLGETVQRTLTPSHIDQSALQDAAQTFTQYLAHNIAIVHEEFQPEAE